jgi:hypothetical protein
LENPLLIEGYLLKAHGDDVLDRWHNLQERHLCIRQL